MRFEHESLNDWVSFVLQNYEIYEIKNLNASKFKVNFTNIEKYIGSVRKTYSRVLYEYIIIFCKAMRYNIEEK